ncbi:RNA polymerase sigma factor [Pontibacter harenae]|uniref:RNA polymerase sigma factor n=1 Tax=Pontibacter harenae TaxID=2894083 RepID=UPI001E2AE86A|nr:RNA polymerase sigma factor [Pontibacter harenae]MCC9167998.1 RNA polymerase sigma factor [Pontibacter harenae]
MDLQEFKTQVLPAKDKLYRLAVLMLHNKEEAEDMLQDVFLKLWTNRHKLHTYTSIEAFAMTVTKNMCLNKLKAGKVRKQIDIAGMELSSDEASPYQRSEVVDSLNKVQGLVAMLPEQQKLILHLREEEGCSFEEIEQITNLNINNIRVLLSRARKSIRDGFFKLENYEVG